MVLVSGPQSTAAVPPLWGRMDDQGERSRGAHRGLDGSLMANGVLRACGRRPRSSLGRPLSPPTPRGRPGPGSRPTRGRPASGPGNVPLALPDHLDHLAVPAEGVERGGVDDDLVALLGVHPASSDRCVQAPAQCMRSPGAIAHIAPSHARRGSGRRAEGQYLHPTLSGHLAGQAAIAPAPVESNCSAASARCGLSARRPVRKLEASGDADDAGASVAALLAGVPLTEVARSASRPKL